VRQAGGDSEPLRARSGRAAARPAGSAVAGSSESRKSKAESRIEALRDPALDALRFLSADTFGASNLGKALSARVSSAPLDALEHLAVGYNAYHLREKAAKYGLARERVCAAASSLMVAGHLQDSIEAATALADRLEGEAVAAIAGLVRAMEKKEQGRERRDTGRRE